MTPAISTMVVAVVSTMGEAGFDVVKLRVN
jgi:hypothetical protein